MWVLMVAKDGNLPSEHFYDVGLVIHSSKNYGNNLTNYSLFNYLKRKKLNVLIIPNHKMYSLFKGNVYKKAQVYSGELSNLNNECKMFILGSDQTLAQWCVGDDFFTCMPWLRSTKYAVTYGSSFGSNDVVYGREYMIKFSYYMSKFDHISLREQNSLSMIRDKFGLKADFVMDPIFLTSQDNYKKMANSEYAKGKKFLGAYILDETTDKLHLIDLIKERRNISDDKIVLNAAKKHEPIEHHDVVENATIEDFLGIIANCDFFVTDSFHGACLAIILNKQFYITNVKNSRGLDRIVSLLNLFNLNSRWITEESQIDDNEINFDEVNKILVKEVKKSKNYLDNVLKEGLSQIKKGSPIVDYIALLEHEIGELKKQTGFLINNVAINSEIRINEMINGTSLDDYIGAIENSALVLFSISGDASVGWKYFRKYCDVDLQLCESFTMIWYNNEKQVKHGTIHSEDTKVIDGLTITVMSDGYKNKKNKGSSVFLIDGRQYSLNNYGLNIVVYSIKNREVVDLVNVPLNVKNNCYVTRVEKK